MLNYFEMPDIYSDFYLLQDVPHGTIRMDYYKSSVTGRIRNCFVYTPPGYEEHPEKRYPVWYLQHGGGEDETGWIWQGKINYILDNLLASGQCREMIVVMNCGYAFFPDGSGHHSRGQIGDVLVKDCIPFIDKKYRTLPHRRARAMSGLSMGGFQSQSTVFQYPEYFASVGLFSSNFIVKNEEDDYTELLSDPKAFNELFDLCFVSWGDQEDMKASNGPLLSSLREKGFRIVSYVTPGYHEWAVWRYSAREFAKLLFRK